MIRKIMISNYGSLVSFNNDDSLFTKNGVIIHGLNGCGKSQICSVLNQVSKLKKAKDEQATVRTEVERKVIRYLCSRISKEAESSDIEISIDNYSLLINSSQQTFVERGDAPDVYVFNDDYVKENVGDLVNLRDQEIRIGQRNVVRDNLLIEKGKKDKELKKINDEIDALIIEHRLATGYSGQARTEKIINKENYFNSINPGEQNLEAKRKLNSLSNPPDAITSHLRQGFPDLSLTSEVQHDISNILVRGVIEPKLTNQIFVDYINNKKRFYEDGVELFKELKTVCPFCLTPKNEDDKVINELSAYILSDYNNCIKILNSAITEIANKQKSLDIFLSLWNTQVDVINEKAKQLGVSIIVNEISYDKEQFIKMTSIIQNKLKDMIKINSDEYQNICNSYTIFIDDLKQYYQEHVNAINLINKTIEQISSLKRTLGEKIIMNEMYLLWNNSLLRDRYNEITSEIEDIKQQIQQTSLVISNDRIPGFFNQIIRILGIYKYELNQNSVLILKLTDNFDISKEGYRISTGERKFIALSYFLAEVLSSAGSSADLIQKSIVIDDPVDSSDYEKFYSFVSVIENLDKILKNIYHNHDIEFGQLIIFTHNALLYERFINSNKLSFYLLTVEDNITKIEKPKKKISLATFSSYIKKITGYIKRMDDKNVKDIGNYIRRVLEIICSVENIDSNHISNINTSSKLNALANHLSHESIERMLDPLPVTYEYIEACIELIEEIKERMPYLYRTIIERYLDNKEIDIYRHEYEGRYLSA